MTVDLRDDLRRCHHHHHVLAISVEAEGSDDASVPTILYQWSPPTIRHILTDVQTTPVMISPHLLSLINGFTSLGTYSLGDDFDVEGGITRFLAEQGNEQHPDSGNGGSNSASGGYSKPTPQIIAEFMSQVGGPAQGGRSMRLVSFPVLSSNVSLVTDADRHLVWKWCKPKSVYRKTGLWGQGLRDTLDHADWNAGKNFMLLVSDVSEEMWKTIATGNRLFSSLDSLEKYGA